MTMGEGEKRRGGDGSYGEVVGRATDVRDGTVETKSRLQTWGGVGCGGGGGGVGGGMKEIHTAKEIVAYAPALRTKRSKTTSV